MRHKVTLIPGDGIGPEVALATQQILEAAGATIDWERIEARAVEPGQGGQFLNEEALASFRRNKVALKGPMATAIAGGGPSINVALRKTLGTSSPHLNRSPNASQAWKSTRYSTENEQKQS